MDNEKFVNKKFLVPGFITVFLFLILVFITARNLIRDDSESMEYSGLNDSLKKQALDDIEDIISADYRKYYDDLKDKGEWIQINPGDYLKNNKKEAETTADKISEYLLKAAGVNDAYAYDDFYMSAFFVWRPSPGFAVGIVAGEPEPVVFTPYTYGRWVYTDYGWYFRAPTYEAEIVHHYGRWVFVPAAGWVWVPGRKWAPAWVHWEYNDDYIAWTPLVPNIYYVSNYIYVPPVYSYINFTAVERRYFIYPDLHKHVFYGTYGNIVIKEKLKIRGDKYFYNYSVRNSGPRITTFEKSFSKWNMKHGDVDFVNRSVEDRKLFRDNTAFGKNYSRAEKFKQDKNERNEKSGIDRKQEKSNRFKNDNIVKDGNKQKFKTDKRNKEITSKNKEKFRDSGREKKQKSQTDKNVTEKRKERGSKYSQSGKNKDFGSGRNKEPKSGNNKEFTSGKNKDFGSGKNTEFKSSGKNRNFNAGRDKELGGGKTRQETGKKTKNK